MIYYLAIKDLHVTCVILSGIGFFVRGLWRLRASPMLQRRWVRVFPHLVDTVLLGSAITMAVPSHLRPRSSTFRRASSGAWKDWLEFP